VDPDDFVPEGSVSKQFWKNLYEGIERWRKMKNRGKFAFIF